ncbi:MAG: sulfite oxidase [Pseudonocardiaceae bacterium]
MATSTRDAQSIPYCTSTRDRGVSRRGLLLGAGGLFAAGAAACSPAAGPGSSAPEAGAGLLPAGKDPRDFVVYGVDPFEMETHRERLADLVTPVQALFVRQNLPLPAPAILADRDRWKTRFEGVARPAELTVAALRDLGRSEVTTVIQCSGNGRGFAPHGPQGSPWRVGAVGNCRWTGVPVNTVIDSLGGPVTAARFLTATGAEPLPAGSDPREHVVERSIPLAKGMADCLLAWELNGAPIPLEHGGPLRLVVPGYWGVNSVKFVGRLACTTDESDAKIQRASYRVRPVGVRGAPDQPSMWEMDVKSLITFPTDRDEVAAGPVEIRGVAWAGEAEVAGVEISTDGGQRWQAATLDRATAGPAGWREFTHTFVADAGEYRLVSRATDVNGETQPEFPEPNERGYGHNGWRNPALTVEVG